MSLFQNLAMTWVVWSVLGGQGISMGAVASCLWQFTGPIPPWPDAEPLGLVPCALSPFHEANDSHQRMSETFGCERSYTPVHFSLK